MSLPTNLNTNEVKNASGVELEFIRVGALKNNPRSMEFAYTSEVPALPYRIQFAHMELGTGKSAIRRSVQKTVYGCNSTYLVDATLDSKIIVTTVVQVPLGNLTAYNQVKDVCAGHGSLLMSRGVDSTILFNCTGVGMEALVNGTLG